MPTFFPTPAAFRNWLQRYHARETELWIGFYKKGSGKIGMTYKEGVDEALCFGWIDGLVRSVDGECFMQRFTPRKSSSHWSLVNVRRFGALESEGRVAPACRAAFDRGTSELTCKASFESPLAELTPTQLKQFRANRTAWTFYEAQPPSYQRVTKHWVTTAKQEATRARRLATLMACSAEGKRVPQFVSPVGKK